MKRSPQQCTLVPDAPDAFTSEKGWDLYRRRDGTRPTRRSSPLKAIGSAGNPVHRPRPGGAGSLAVGPDAEGVEIYTGTYAARVPRPARRAALLEACAETARRAQARGLVVNAGHDLNLRNIPPLISTHPTHLAEASIGHELTADRWRWVSPPP